MLYCIGIINQREGQSMESTACFTGHRPRSDLRYEFRELRTRQLAARVDDAIRLL